METVGTGMASSVASSALRQLLNRQDAVLGPWAPGRDPLEDALQAFAGLPGGPGLHPWEAGLSFDAGIRITTSEGTGAGALPAPVQARVLMLRCCVIDKANLFGALLLAVVPLGPRALVYSYVSCSCVLMSAL